MEVGEGSEVAETHLDNISSHTLTISNLVHVPLQIHVEELEHEVELRIRVDDVE